MASHHMTASVVASTQPQTVVPVSVPQPLQGGSQGIQYYLHPQGN